LKKYFAANGANITPISTKTATAMIKADVPLSRVISLWSQLRQLQSG